MRTLFLLMIVAVLGYTAGLGLEVLADGDESKLMTFVKDQSNPELANLLSTAQMSTSVNVWDNGAIPFMPIINTGYMSDAVLRMISEAYIDFTIEKKTVTDPITNSKYFSNEVTECIVQPKEALEFETCIICTLKGTKYGFGPEDQDIGKGEKEFPNGFPANTPQTLEIIDINEGFSNDVRYVHGVKLEVCKLPECIPSFNTFDTLSHGARQTDIDSILNPVGVTISTVANHVTHGGEDELIIFDGDQNSNPDPDLEVPGYKILIIPRLGTLPANPLTPEDDPNDSADGGIITLTMDNPVFFQSFVFIDHDNDKPAFARAYDAKIGGNLIKEVPILNKGNKSVQTVNVNAENVLRLEIHYEDSGGVTNFKILCEKPTVCDCEKPDRFVVTYNGPDIDKVQISKKGKDKVWIQGPFTDGDDIIVDAIALGFKNKKVYPETTYNFFKDNNSVGYITIHTSCSQLLFVGQEFFYKEGTSDEIKLTVDEGTLKGKQSIPDASCPAPPDPDPECEDCEKPDKFIVKYNGPGGATVEISKNGKDKVSLPGTFEDGENIEVDAVALGFKGGKVYPETTYKITNDGAGGTISIHTSCSQLLFVGQMFVVNEGTSDEITLTVVSGTKDGVLSIPDANCKLTFDKQTNNLFTSISDSGFSSFENNDDYQGQLVSSTGGGGNAKRISDIDTDDYKDKFNSERIYENAQCKGIQKLTAQYEGILSPVTIKVNDKRVGKLVFENVISGKTEITIEPKDGKDKLRKVTNLKIYDENGHYLDRVRMITSCDSTIDNDDHYFGKRGMPVNIMISNVGWLYK